jgi:hypothetical protein
VASFGVDRLRGGMNDLLVGWAPAFSRFLKKCSMRLGRRRFLSWSAPNEIVASTV